MFNNLWLHLSKIQEEDHARKIQNPSNCPNVLYEEVGQPPLPPPPIKEM